MNYYYFAASLPAVTPDAPPPYTPAQFLARASEWLQDGDLAAVRQVLEHNPAPPLHPGVARWRTHEIKLRNAVVRARAARLRCDPAPYLHPGGGDPDILLDRAVAEALARPTPLEREQALDRARWTLAGQLAAFNPFALDAILAYAIQLTLAARWTALDEHAGRAKAQSLEAQPLPAEARGNATTGA